MLLRNQILFTLALAVVSVTGLAQKKNFSEEQLLKGKLPAVIVPLPEITGWQSPTSFILSKKVHPDSSSKQFLIDAKTGNESSYQPDQSFKPKQEKRVVIKSDDLFLVDQTAETRLTNDKTKEVNAVLSPDRNYVAFTKMNDLFVIDLNTKKETRITSDGTDLILNGYASWVYMEEILGRATQYKAFWWSPDSKQLAFMRFDDTQVPVFTLTDAAGDHGVVENTRYPKVGDKNPEVKVGVFNISKSATTWADFDSKADQYFGMPYWKPNSSSLLVQWMPRTQDVLKIYEVDPATGTKKEFYSEEQKTWVEFDEGGERLEFLKNGKGYLYRTDKSGFSHIYYHGNDGKLINAVTSGKYSVIDVKYIDEKNSLIYFTAQGRENTARTDLYSVKINGKDLRRLTFGDYNHAVTLGPEAQYFITNYSNASTPNRLALLDNKGKLIKELGNARGSEFDNYNIAKTELIRVKSEDDLYDLPAFVTWPFNMDPNKKYPVLISIYGGPGRQDAWDRWAFSSNQQWYAKEGLIQIAIDHRGSAHFGKEGMNYMHRNLGYWEIKDYSSVVKYLIANKNADPDKICITGFSYGGYMSAYALTYGADLFTYGMAGGTVADWRLYDTHYSERLMDTPAENPEGYKASSILTHVSKYKGMLQIVHGIVDDNVHMQNSIQLISRLQELKKDFEFMIYSGSRHGIGGNKAAHYQNLKTKFIYKYLLEKPVVSGVLR